jgi:hypothetical protein
MARPPRPRNAALGPAGYWLAWREECGRVGAWRPRRRRCTG